MKTYTSSNQARLSIFFNDGGDFELDKREVITSLRKSTANIASKAITEQKEKEEFEKFDDIEEKLNQTETTDISANTSESEEQSSANLEDGAEKNVNTETKPSVLSMITPEAETTVAKDEEVVQVADDEGKAEIISVEEVFTDSEGKQISTKNSTGRLVISEDRTSVTIFRTIDRDLSLDEIIRQKLLSELPDTTTYLASNSRKQFDIAEEKDRLSYELLVHINRFRYLAGLPPVEKGTNLSSTTSINVDIKVKSTMPYLTVTEVAEMFFKHLLENQHPKLLLDVDGIVINIGSISFGKEDYYFIPTMSKDAFTVSASVMVYLGKKGKDNMNNHE